MTMRASNRKQFLPMLAAALALTILSGLIPVRAVSDKENEFIVKYKESAAWLMEDDSVAFEVVSEQEMKRLDRLGLLEWYEPDGEGILLDSSYYESCQWNLDVIGAEGAFAGEHLGQGVRVGVVDSGVNPHPDLKDRLLEGRSYMENGENAADTADEYGHGTRVAGLIAGAGEHGYIGVSPGAEIVPLKVTDEKSVKVSAICQAIYGGVDEFDCDVLNLSLGLSGEYESLREAVEYAGSKGVVLVAAAGNTGWTTIYYPAGYESVIGVGAVDREGTWSARSNHNASVFLTAPGVNVRSTDSTGGYDLYTGTSFAVPQVSGAAAVLLGIDPTLTPMGIMELLAQSAIDRGEPGCDEYYGHGILNVTGSVAALTGEDVPGREEPCSLLPETGPASRIRNNTGMAVNCTYFLAEYSETGAFLGGKAYPFYIPAYDTVTIETPPEGSWYGQFVYETETIKPLTAERKSY